MKKVLSVLLASATALTALGGLAACDGDGGNANTITIWAPQESVACYQKLVDEFKQQDAYKGYDFKIVPKGEDKVQAALATDPASGADVFFFPSDHMDKFVQDDVLLTLGGEVGAKYSEAIKARDSEFTYEYVLDDNGNCRAFPATSDNAFYLWYDSTYFDTDEVKSLDTMLAKAKADDKNIIWDYGTGWYTNMFFFANGCKADYEGSKYEIDYNSANGKAAAEAMIKYLVTDNVMANKKECIIKGAIGDDIVKGMQNNTCVAGIGGGWFADQLPEKAKATVLPKATIGGVEKQLVSFYGGKYCGVNSKRKHLAVSVALADYLTNEAAQKARFQATKTGPSNKKVAELPEVQAAPTVATIMDMVKANAVYVQKNQDPLWEPMQDFCTGITKKTVTVANVQAKLDDLVKTIKDKA